MLKVNPFRSLFQDEYAARELQALVLTTRRRGAGSGASAGAAVPSWWSRCASSLKKGTTAIMDGRGSRRPLYLLCVLMFLQQFSGAYVLLFYAVTFFQVI